MFRKLTSILILFIPFLPGKAQESIPDSISHGFLPDHLRAISSLDPSEKDSVKKGDSLTFYTQEGRALSKEDMMMKFKEKGEPQLRSYVDSSLIIRACVITGYKEPDIQSTTKEDSGKSIPDSFELDLLDGSSYAFSKKERRDSILVINFWFTACKPCKMEIPELNRLVEEFEEEPVHFLAITGDPASKIRSFLKKQDFAYTQGVSAKHLYRSFGVQSFPTHIVVDRNGDVVFYRSGYSAGRVEEVKRSVQGLLE